MCQLHNVMLRKFFALSLRDVAHLFFRRTWTTCSQLSVVRASQQVAFLQWSAPQLWDVSAWNHQLEYRPLHA